jgi:hypothetical protein
MPGKENLSMALKNATAAWKKAKPITLTKTGVSEELRKLEAYPEHLDEDMRQWIPILEHVKKSLGTALTDKAIAKEKKAVDCLHQIEHDVSGQIAHINHLRTVINNALHAAFVAGRECLKEEHPEARDLEAVEHAVKQYLDTTKLDVPFLPKTQLLQRGWTGFVSNLNEYARGTHTEKGMQERLRQGLKNALEQLTPHPL